MESQVKTPFIQTNQEFDNLNAFFNYHHATPPLDSDLDIRECDKEFQRSFKNKCNPLHHHIYCISIEIENGNVTRTAIHGTTFSKASMAFIVHGNDPAIQSSTSETKTFFILFSENFLVRYRNVAGAVAGLPFFQSETTCNYVTAKNESDFLETICTNIINEYRSGYADRLELLTSYIHILIAQFGRYYGSVSQSQVQVSRITDIHLPSLTERFKHCIKQNIAAAEVDKAARFVNFYAEKLFVHPNHLNAVVKRDTGKPAITMIHKQVIEEAKLMLIDTGMSVKEIAYRLAFKEPSHFNAFFRKYTSVTPVSYRMRRCA
jgi:AraC-like DNA-binding protein